MSVFDQFRSNDNPVLEMVRQAMIKWYNDNNHSLRNCDYVYQNILMAFELGNIELILTLKGATDGEEVAFQRQVAYLCEEFYEPLPDPILSQIREMRATKEARQGLQVEEKVDIENKCYSYRLPGEEVDRTADEINRMWKMKAFL